MTLKELFTNRCTVRLLPAVLAVCGLSTSQARCAVIELSVPAAYVLPDPSSQDVGSVAQTAVIRRYLELHPEIRLRKSTGLLVGNDPSMVTMMQIAGDVAPDIIYVNFVSSDTYIQRGFLKPLDEYMAAVDKVQLARRVPRVVRDVVYRRGPDGKKHWYAVPGLINVRVMAYRRDLFARAGLDPDRPPRTWSELEAYSRKLSDPAKGKYGLMFYKGDAGDLSTLLWARGGDLMFQNKSGEWVVKLNTPEAVDALYFYVKMCKIRWKARDGKIYRGYVDRDITNDVMAPGDPFAMSYCFGGDRMWYQPEVVGLAPVPHADEVSHGATLVDSSMLAVYAGIRDPMKAKAAFDLLWFLGSDDANQIRVKTFIQHGYGKFVNPELLERFGYTDYLKQADKEWIRVYKDALRNGRPVPYGKNCAVVLRELSRPLEQALNDKIVLAALDHGDEMAAKRQVAKILSHAELETSKRMYGTLPPDLRRVRHSLTLVFLLLTLAGFALATAYLLRMFRRSAPAQTPGYKRAFIAYILLIPAVASVFVWHYFPLIRGTEIAFQDYSVMGASRYVGVQNFAEVLFDHNFWHSVYVTVLYTMLYMVLAFLSPIFLALLLSEIPTGKIVYRTAFYLPTVLSGLVVVFLWKSFYRPAGLLNAVLGCVGIHLNVGWLESPALAMLAVLLPVAWAGMGPGSLIYLAAFKTIPDELYEAAEVDGAGMVRKVFRITLPSIKMLIMINAVGALIGAFMSSETILAMTGGGPYTPYGATEVVGLQLFYTAFVYLKFGVANAMAWVLGFMLLGFTMFQLRNLSRVEFKGGR